jgi:uncharacterized sporulation protein YeaH/YhbH (DUF444 family)
MSWFIDRRPNGRHKSAVNRQRFMQRYKNQIQKAARRAIGQRQIKQVDASGEKISIPSKDINEPNFHFDQGGQRNIILPGNKEFLPGDLIPRPPLTNQGSGNAKPSDSPKEEDDDFIFEITKEEFLELFFEDLALPNLVKTKIAQVPEFKSVRAGYTSDGIPSNLNIVRSLRCAISRRVALAGPHRKKIKELTEELTLLEKTQTKSTRITELKKEIEKLKNKINALPFIDTFDLKYNNRVQHPKPTSQAVMFCLMDVSGSMDTAKKDIAKRFYILLYLFLKRVYENVELVFIRHHTAAKEVDEQEFFYSRETGGTIVSSALELMEYILQSRYPSSEWNIYGAQASDGDNWNNDSPRCQKLLVEKILPQVQYFAYIEIMPRHHQSLWDVYLNVKEHHPNFAMKHIIELKDIYPVFRELFKKDSQSIS